FRARSRPSRPVLRGGNGAPVRMRSATRQNQGLSNHFHVPYEAVISSSRDHVLGKPWSRTSFAGSQLKMPLFGLVIFVSTANPFDVACSSTKQSPPALGPLPGLNGNGPNAGGDCFVLLHATSKGFAVDTKITKPNNGIFNCDPANEVRLQGFPRT